MTAGPRALAVSLLAHAAVFAALARGSAGDDRHDAARRNDESAAIPIEVLPAEPLEVQVFRDAPGRTGTAAGGEVRRPRIAVGRASAETPASTGGRQPGEPSAPAEPGKPGKPGALTMRGLRHDLSLSGDALARIAGDRPAPAPVVPTGRIQSHGAEGRIDDATATYRVHADGTVDVRNKDDFDIHVELPLPTPGRLRNTARAIGDGLAAWRDDPYRDTRVGPSQDLPRHLQSTPDSCQRYTDPLCDANPKHAVTIVEGGFIVPLIGGRADVTAYLQRKLTGTDPYASRKQKLLDATRAERVERGGAFRAAQLGRSAELMANNLEALSHATLDAAARRQALFDLWDECAEGDGTDGAAGERARAMVIGWIGAHLPVGAPGAFSADDIARLDAHRASKQHFAPYPAR